ncbi:MAG: hypothetical protein AB7V50_01090 [Vampirovibrionia bacterium]
MNDIFDFIVVKNLQIELFTRSLVDYLSGKETLGDNLYVSILPSFDNYYFIEFADFLPVSRYRDVKTFEFVDPLVKTFSKVFYFYKNSQLTKSIYKKYLHGSLEQDYKKEEAFEKGLKYDLIIDPEEVMAFVSKVWSGKLDINAKEPIIFQLVRDGVILETPVRLEYQDFYGEQ